MLVVTLIVILSLLTGFAIRVLASLKCHTPANHNKCLECGEQVPEGFHICMRCYSCKETQELTAEK